VHDQQAVGRAYRLGQKKHVYVYRLLTFGTYEETFLTENVFKLNLSKRVIDKRNPERYGDYKTRDLKRYFHDPKDDSDLPPVDMSIFEKKDEVLDALLKHSESGSGPKILDMDLTETFDKEDEETYLTPEDTLAVTAEADKEKQLREEGNFVDVPRPWQRDVGVPLFEGHASAASGLVNIAMNAAEVASRCIVFADVTN
jgi:hypothetical protein